MNLGNGQRRPESLHWIVGGRSKDRSERAAIRFTARQGRFKQSSIRLRRLAARTWSTGSASSEGRIAQGGSSPHEVLHTTTVKPDVYWRRVGWVRLSAGADPVFQGKKASRGKKASQEKKKDPVAAGSQMEEQETLYAKREEVGRLRA